MSFMRSDRPTTKITIATSQKSNSDRPLKTQNHDRYFKKSISDPNLNIQNIAIATSKKVNQRSPPLKT